MQIHKNVLLAGQEMNYSDFYIKCFGSDFGIMDALRGYVGSYDINFMKGYTVHIITLNANLTFDAHRKELERLYLYLSRRLDGVRVTAYLGTGLSIGGW